MTDSETSPLPFVVILYVVILYKESMRKVPVRERTFDLVLRLGEIDTAFNVDRAGPGAAASNRGLP